jgi:hypothetical protein
MTTLRKIGVGLPDGSLFTPDQFFKASDTPMDPQKPTRGIIEARGTKDDAWIVANCTVSRPQERRSRTPS